VRKVDAPLAVDFFHHDRHDVTNMNDVLHVFHAPVGQLGDMDQTFLIWQHFRERSEVHDPGNARLKKLPSPHFARDVIDPFYGLFGARFVCGSDEDRTVILDIDGHTRLIDYLIDHLAARPNDIADLLRIDMQRNDPWGVRRQIGSRCWNN